MLAPPPFSIARKFGHTHGDGQLDRQTRFAYDGTQIALQFDKAGAGDVAAADLSHRYLWQPDAVDQLMADEQLLEVVTDGVVTGHDLSTPGNVVWPLADHLGTIRDLATLDAQTGMTVVGNHREYSSFGEMESQTNAAVDCLFGFTGRALDKATGLQDNWHRKYTADARDWMNKDLVGLTAGDTSIGRYVNNGPVSLTDANGCWTVNPRDAVHETIIREAWKKIFTPIPEDPTRTYISAKPDDKDLTFRDGLLIGTRWVDMPEDLSGIFSIYLGRLFDLNRGIVGDYWQTYESHFGDNVYYHAMVPKTGFYMDRHAFKTAEDMQKDLIKWICGRYAMAQEETDPEAQGRYLGSALHLIADLYCPSHVIRGPFVTSPISMFQDADEQDPSKHGNGDDPTFSPLNMQYARVAVEATRQLIKMFVDKRPAYGVEVGSVQRWLVDGPLKLADDAELGGSAGDYRKTGKEPLDLPPFRSSYMLWM